MVLNDEFGDAGYGSELDAIVGGFDDFDLDDSLDPLRSTDTVNALEEHDRAASVTPEQPSTTKSNAAYDSDSESGDMTCAICLHNISLPDMAMVKGCDHLYCAQCILQWTLHKSDASCVCPTCKRPFSYLLTYRALDGTLNDFPMEESVVLLRRAHWFEEWVRESDNALCQSLFEEAKLADDTAWQEDYDEDEYWEEDEKMEAFYFSSAAGKARIVLGNRRFGSGGYISGGHRQARPIRNNDGASGSGSGSAGACSSKSVKKQASKKQKNKGMIKASNKDIRPETSKAIHIATPNAQTGVKEREYSIQGKSFVSDGYGSSPASSLHGSHGMGGFLGSSPSAAAPGFGRRATRKARIAAEKNHLSESIETEHFHTIWSE